MKNNTRTTVSGITMHNVGVFFIIDWTGDGNMVRPQRMGLAVLRCKYRGWCKTIACKRRLRTLSRRSTDNDAMPPFQHVFSILFRKLVIKKFLMNKQFELSDGLAVLPMHVLDTILMTGAVMRCLRSC